MKNLLLVALIVVPIFLSAQEDATIQKSRIELGANMARFMKNFISLNNQEIQEDNASIIMLKVHTGDSRAMRFGLDLQGSSTKNDDGIIVNSNLINMKIGYESKKLLSKKWEAYFGGDLLFKVLTAQQTSNDPFQGMTELKSSDISIGGEAVLGFQFNLSSRVSLFTESYLVASSNTQTFKVNAASQNSEEQVTGFSFNLFAPSSLYLSYKF